MSSWQARRIIFDAPEPNDGLVAIWPRVYLNTMAATYPGTATAVVILRHGAIPLAMGDALWTKYGIGEMFKIMAGVNIQQVPYRGTTAILPDLLAPHELLLGNALRTGLILGGTSYLQDLLLPSEAAGLAGQ